MADCTGANCFCKKSSLPEWPEWRWEIGSSHDFGRTVALTTTWKGKEYGIPLIVDADVTKWHQVPLRKLGEKMIELADYMEEEIIRVAE